MKPRCAAFYGSDGHQPNFVGVYMYILYIHHETIRISFMKVGMTILAHTV